MSLHELGGSSFQYCESCLVVQSLMTNDMPDTSASLLQLALSLALGWETLLVLVSVLYKRSGIKVLEWIPMLYSPTLISEVTALQHY